MPKKDWGKKRLCSNCGARFYDFYSNPIKCPKCETIFEPKINKHANRITSRANSSTKNKPLALDQNLTKEKSDEVDLEVEVEDTGDEEDKGVLEDASDLIGEDDDVPKIPENSKDDAPYDR